MEKLIAVKVSQKVRVLPESTDVHIRQNTIQKMRIRIDFNYLSMNRGFSTRRDIFMCLCCASLANSNSSVASEQEERGSLKTQT